LDEALRAGEVPLMVAAVVRAVLSFSNDRGDVSWPSWATIGTAMGGRAPRTAGEWLRQARELGWLEREHRCRRLADGTLVGETNLWRVVLPPVVEARRLARKHGGDGKGRPTPSAPQNRRGSDGVGHQRFVMIDPDVQQAAAEAKAAPSSREGSGETATGRRLRERVEALAARVLDRSSDPP
jgi:hypothetical protein